MKSLRVILPMLALLAAAVTGYSLAEQPATKAGGCCASGGSCCEASGAGAACCK